MLNFYFNYEVPKFGFAQNRLEARIVCGLDSRRHLPLPERFPDSDTEFADAVPTEFCDVYVEQQRE